MICGNSSVDNYASLWCIKCINIHNFDANSDRNIYKQKVLFMSDM